MNKRQKATKRLEIRRKGFEAMREKDGKKKPGSMKK